MGPDYKVEIVSQQRYLLFSDGSLVYRIDTQTGHTWLLWENKTLGKYWKPIADQDKKNLPSEP